MPTLPPVLFFRPVQPGRKEGILRRARTIWERIGTSTDRMIDIADEPVQVGEYVLVRTLTIEKRTNIITRENKEPTP